MTEEKYITILDRKISYDDERMGIDTLRFYEKNPRVLSKLVQVERRDGVAEDKQALIMQKMHHEASVKKLIATIEAQGGITEPLVVQNQTHDVLEGNSRLAALRILYERTQDEKYLDAPCRLVHLEQDQIDAFLYQRHVEGQTSWDAFDKAYSIYYRVVEEDTPIAEYAKRTGQTENYLGKQIDIIKLMTKEGVVEQRTDMFSHYEQFVKSNKLRGRFDSAPGLRRYLLDTLKEDSQSLKAADLRDLVPQIADKPSVLKKWMEGNIDFEEAVSRSKISQPKQYAKKALDSLKEISKKNTDNLTNNDLNALQQTMKKCSKELQRIEALLLEKKK